VKLVQRIVGAGEELETRAGQPVDTPWWFPAFMGAESFTGKWVTVEQSLSLPTVYAAIRVLSDAVGTLPLLTYQRRDDGTRAKARQDQVYDLLSVEPNPEMTARDLWQLVTAHLNSWGDAFLGKQIRGNRVKALWPIRPDLVDVARERGQKVFYVRDINGNYENGGKPYTQADIIHIKALTLEGLRGASPIELAREAIGHGLALDEYANRFFSNGAVPRVALKHPGKLGDQAHDRLKADWKSKYGGLRKSNETAVLEEGMEVEVLSLPFEDAQFVEQQKFSVQQVSRIFRIKASMIDGSTGDSLTYKTVESDALHFVTWSLRPWLVAIEQALWRDKDLFPNRGLYPEFLVDALLRADTKTRYEAYQIGINSKFLKPSEARERENLEPDPELDKAAAAPPPPPVAPAPAPPAGEPQPTE
jgi:HK97 family phage portal protein